VIFAAIAAVVLLFGFVAFTGAPYVPSRRRDLQKAFDELYQLKKTDVLVDIDVATSAFDQFDTFITKLQAIIILQNLAVKTIKPRLRNRIQATFTATQHYIANRKQLDTARQAAFFAPYAARYSITLPKRR
jgi:hypothetical protein